MHVKPITEIDLQCCSEKTGPKQVQKTNDSIFAVEGPEEHKNKKGVKVIKKWHEGSVHITTLWDEPLVYTGESYNLENPSEYEEMIRKGKIAIVDKYVPQKTSSKRRWHLFHRTKSMDYQIDRSKQECTGNCSFLSAVNALSYSEKGRELIKEMINYDDNGAYVTLKGVNKTVFIPYKKVWGLKFTPFRYTDGDDDMKILELAAAKFVQEGAKGNLGEFAQFHYEDDNSAEGPGFPTDAWHLLIEGECKEIKGKINLSELPENFDFAVYFFSTNDYPDEMKFSWQALSRRRRRDVKDAKTGKTVSLIADHAYAIKSINNGIVELVNPWNSKKSIFVNASDISKGLVEYGIFN
jgi:hypothetical protein